MPKRYKRPHKFTREAQDTILRHIRTGGVLKHACEAAGVGYSSVNEWIRKGADGEKPYKDFADKVLKARASDAMRSQSIITRAEMAGDWKAAAWSLERKYPKEYGQAAAHAAAAVTVRTGGAAAPNTDDDGASTTVQFYLPENGRRPQDEDEEA